MISARAALATALLGVAAAGCAPNPAESYVRGHGLTVADLPLRDRVAIYQEAVGGAFQVGDPSLYLLLDPRLLPRTGGYDAGSERMTSGLQNSLLKSHIVQGLCEPATEASKLAHCNAPLAGYVVRFSEVFRMPADTVSVNLYVQRYSTPTSVGVSELRFERIYKLVHLPTGWTAVVEGRVQLESP
ncbi:MAG TPA: hypothetical protein VF737_11890 [Gemmatimonadaceae bacterium]